MNSKVRRYSNSLKKLSKLQVLEILEKCDACEIEVNLTGLKNPEVGDVFLIKTKQPCQPNVSDGLCWKKSGGGSKFSKGSVTVWKHYYYLGHTPKGQKKFVYDDKVSKHTFHLDSPKKNITLVQYLGCAKTLKKYEEHSELSDDESEPSTQFYEARQSDSQQINSSNSNDQYQDVEENLSDESDEDKVYGLRPHGNSKSNQRNFHPTCPSMKDEIKLQVHNTAKSTKKIYAELVNAALKDPLNSELETTKVPTGSKQIDNFKYSQVKQLKILNDDILSLNALRLIGLDNFVDTIMIAPHLQVFLAHPGSIQLTQRLADRSLESGKPFFVYYDTTYNVGDYYVSFLSAKNLELASEPAYVICVNIHESKSEDSHFNFFNQFVHKILKFNENVCMITDREQAIINAINRSFGKEGLSNLLFFCENHIKTDLEFWLDKELKQKLEGLLKYKSIEVTANDPAIQAQKTKLKSQFKGFLFSALELTNCATTEELVTQKEASAEKWSIEFKAYFENCIEPAIRNNLEKRAKFKFIKELSMQSITNNLSEATHFSFKKWHGKKNARLDSVVLDMYKYVAFFIGEFNRAYKGLGDYSVKKEFKKSKPLFCPLVIDFESQIIELNQLFTIAKKEKEEKPKNISQLEVAEICLEQNLFSFDSKSKTYIVDSPFDDSYGTVRITSEKLRCSCHLKQECFHKILVGLALEQLIDIDSPKINLKESKKQFKKSQKSGRKGPPEKQRTRNELDRIKKSVSSKTKSLAKDTLLRMKQANEDEEEGLSRLRDEILDKQEIILQKDRLNDFDKFCDNLGNESDSLSYWSSSSTSDSVSPFKKSIQTIKIEDEATNQKLFYSYQKLENNLNTKEDLIRIAKSSEWYYEDHLNIFLQNAIENCDKEDRNNFLYLPPSVFYFPMLQYYLLLKYYDTERKCLIFPFNSNSKEGEHWILGLIFMNAKAIVILDSGKVAQRSYISFFQRLAVTAKIYSKILRPDSRFRNWQYYLPTDTPKQNNGHDCGPRVCWFGYKVITSLIGETFDRKFKEKIAKSIEDSFDTYEQVSLHPKSDEPVDKKFIKYFKENSFKDHKISAQDIKYQQIFDLY